MADIRSLIMRQASSGGAGIRPTAAAAAADIKIDDGDVVRFAGDDEDEEDNEDDEDDVEVDEAAETCCGTN